MIVFFPSLKRKRKQSEKELPPPPEVNSTLKELVEKIIKSLETNPENWKVDYVMERFNPDHQLSNGKITVLESGSVRSESPYNYISIPLYLRDRLIKKCKPFFVAYQDEKDKRESESNLRKAAEAIELL